jgi:hypothetical protein
MGSRHSRLILKSSLMIASASRALLAVPDREHASSAVRGTSAMTISCGGAHPYKHGVERRLSAGSRPQQRGLGGDRNEPPRGLVEAHEASRPRPHAPAGVPAIRVKMAPRRFSDGTHSRRGTPRGHYTNGTRSTMQRHHSAQYCARIKYTRVTGAEFKDGLVCDVQPTTEIPAAEGAVAR